MCWRHQISRKAKKLTAEIATNIEDQKEFTHISHRRKLEITEAWSSSATNDEAFESRVETLNQIIEALANPNIILIGVYGLGGVGKTTLVREVAKKVKEKSPDVTVVYVEVKQNPKLEKVQQEIADMLGLELKQESRVLRATSLCQRLEQEKNILVILDDLWEMLDLKEIGMVFGKENKNYKILMTSRKRDVLFKMDSQKYFWLRELTNEESWELFKVKVMWNESSKGEELLPLAKEVVAKCGGLPIAIVTIAAALKRKEEITEWRDVLRRLQNQDYDEIHRPIVASYENLKDDRLRSIFVLAGVVSSSATIDLFKCCYGLGLFNDMNNLDVRINELKDSCLLQDTDHSRSHFSMHDVVRDTAKSIAMKDEQFFLKINGKVDEDEWITDDKLKSCKKLLLDFSDSRELPKRLQCSNLTFFYLRCKYSSVQLPHNFLKGMPKLKVLVLINMTFDFLSSLISLSPNLHSLCLDECVLENIEGIGELKGLKILSLSGSKFSNLPQEIGRLTKLQLLDLRRCVQLESIRPGVLLNLQMLEVLLIGDSFSKWAVGDEQSTASLAEIKYLRRLNTLAICVPDQNMLPKEQLFESLQLQRYEVCIGNTWHRFGESRTSRFLKLDLHTVIVDTKHYFRCLLDHVEDLRVEGLAGLKNVVPDLNEKGLLEMKHLRVYDNRELQFIADSVDHKDIFPNLESLHAKLSNLVTLCNGFISGRSFSKLKVVSVSFCPKMESLFSFSLPTCLPHLNEIQVQSCYVLKGIFSDDGKVAGPLQFAELRTFILVYVPALVGFYFEDKTSSKAQQKKTQLANDISLVLFSQKTIFPNLETLMISSARKLKKIWNWQDGASFRKLKTLNVRCCHGISKLLPVNVLENLAELEVSSCDSLEAIFDFEGTREEEIYVVNLRKLILDELPKLKQIWNKDSQEILNFKSLSEIQVSKCHSLKYLFPVSLVMVPSKLQKLSIRSCSELETIVVRKEGANAPLNVIVCQVTALYLEQLPKLVRFYPGTCSIEWPKLEILHCRYMNRDWNIFGLGLLAFEESHCQDGLEVSLLLEKSIPMLTNLELDYNESMTTWIEQYQPKLCLKKLKIFKLGFFHDVPSTFPRSFLQRIHAPEFHVAYDSYEYGSLEDIFSLDGEEKQYGNGMHIKAVNLHKLSKLKCIHGEGNELDHILKSLHVSSCTNLQLVAFNHLTSLVVYKYEGILNLIALSIVKSLSLHITTIEIRACEKIKKIVADEEIDDEIISEITFSKLKTLKLCDLSQLESFCSSINCAFSFPVLENVVIKECPKLNLFSKQAPETPALQCVKYGSWPFEESYWTGDLNSTTLLLYTNQLSHLHLSGQPELKQIWHMQFLDGAFCKLHTLTFSNCEWFPKVFQLNVLKFLVNLKKLEIKFCNLAEIVFHLEEAANEKRGNAFAMKLETLRLVSLPNLKQIWNKDTQGIIDFPKLISLGLTKVPKLDLLSIEKSVPVLTNLELDYNESMIAWIEQYPPKVCLKELKIFKLRFLHDVPSNFPWSFLHRINALETHLEYGWFEDINYPQRLSSGETQFGNGMHVKALNLHKLPKLKCTRGEGNELDHILKSLLKPHVSSCSNLQSVALNHLTSLEVYKYEGILDLIALSIAKSLSLHITTIEIRACKKMKKIVADEETDDEIICEITFSKLKTLNLCYLPQLESFCSSINCVFNFPILENVVIEECPKLNLFSKQAPETPALQIVEDSNWSTFTKSYWTGDLNSTILELYTHQLYNKLRDLNLSEYPELKQIWDTQLPDGAFYYLSTLTLSNCEWFPKVLRLNVLKCLLNLKRLKVKSCNSIEIVFDLEEASNEEKDNALAMNLEVLSLVSLSNLKQVWNKDPQGILDFPKLTTLELAQVPQLDLLLVEKTIPNLRTLEVDEAVMEWLGQFPAEHFNKLTRLGLYFLNDVNTRFLYCFLQKMSKLECVSFKDGSFEEIFPFENQVVEGNQYGRAVQVKFLCLENLQKISHIRKEGQELDPSLKNLEKLYIVKCSSLLNLGPSSLTFNFLKILKVKKCKQLSYLMTPSTTKSLNNLKKLVIEECSMIKEIICGKVVDAETIDEITFSSLKILKLKNLPCLKSFCPMNYVFNFPSLENVVIWQCPSLRKFSNGVSNTPHLQCINGEDDKDWSELGLNSFGVNTYTYKVAFQISDDDWSDEDSESVNEQLNAVVEEDKEYTREEEHKEHAEVKQERMNMYLIEQRTTSCPESRDTDLQASTNKDFNLNAPLTGISQEYQTSEEEGNQKKTEAMIAFEPSTTSYSESKEAHKKQAQMPHIQISNFDTEKRMEETGNTSDDKSLLLEISTSATSSHDSVSEEPVSKPVLMGRQEGLEQDQVTIELQGRTVIISEVGQNVTEPMNSSVSTVSTPKELQDVAQSSPISQSFFSKANAAELSLGRAQEESFDLQKEKLEVNIPNVDPSLDTLPLHSSEEVDAQTKIKYTDVEASKASMHVEVPQQNKESTPSSGQDGKSNAPGEGTMDFDVGTAATPLSRSQIWLIALCFTCFALLGSYFLLAYWGSRISMVSFLPSLPISKGTVELNKDQISLLKEAYARYPNLGGPREDFSPRFHSWAYKTFADLLYFLKTESPITITKERKKEFDVLCNEVIHFGFDKTWVEQMRKRVAKDPEVDHAHKYLMEILEKEMELKQLKEMLNAFLEGKRKKCFDFI